MDRSALLREARRRRKLYPSSAALRLAGLWFSGPVPVRALRLALEEAVAFLPSGLLARLVAHARGYLVVVPQIPAGLVPRCSCYLEGEVVVEGQVFSDVACLLAADLARGEGIAEHELAHLLDHLLGSDGRPGGAYLSEGAGATPALAALGEEIQACYHGRPMERYPRGIGPRDYWARAVQRYCRWPQRLRQEDPAAYRFLSGTFLAEAFWEDMDGQVRTLRWLLDSSVEPSGNGINRLAL